MLFLPTNQQRQCTEGQMPKLPKSTYYGRAYFNIWLQITLTTCWHNACRRSWIATGSIYSTSNSSDLLGFICSNETYNVQCQSYYQLLHMECEMQGLVNWHTKCTMTDWVDSTVETCLCCACEVYGTGATSSQLSLPLVNYWQHSNLHATAMTHTIQLSSQCNLVLKTS